MISNAYSVSLSKNPLISIRLIPGHFATNSAHCNYFLDVSDLKTNALKAKDVAQELALPYLTRSLVDTIVCMENTEVLGAFIAEELMREGTSIVNSGKEIRVITPLQNVNGKLTFHDNMQEVIRNQNIILLVASISSGRTINAAIECLDYYGGKLIGISALFCSNPEKFEQGINAVFTSEDITNYQFYRPSECDLCAKGSRLDAIISSDGYTRLQ